MSLVHHDRIIPIRQSQIDDELNFQDVSNPANYVPTSNSVSVPTGNLSEDSSSDDSDVSDSVPIYTNYVN